MRSWRYRIATGDYALDGLNHKSAMQDYIPHPRHRLQAQVGSLSHAGFAAIPFEDETPRRRPGPEERTEVAIVSVSADPPIGVQKKRSEKVDANTQLRWSQADDIDPDFPALVQEPGLCKVASSTQAEGENARHLGFRTDMILVASIGVNESHDPLLHEITAHGIFSSLVWIYIIVSLVSDDRFQSDDPLTEC
jgi:hypothetical protein